MLRYVYNVCICIYTNLKYIYILNKRGVENMEFPGVIKKSCWIWILALEFPISVTKCYGISKGKPLFVSPTLFEE